MPNTSQKPQDSHERYTRMVGALNSALEVFCSYNKKTFDEVLTDIMLPIAEVMEVSQIFVDRQIEKDGANCLQRGYRWDKNSGGLAIKDVELLHENEIVAEWADALRKGGCVNRCLSDTSGEERALMDRFGVKSITMAPIFMHEEFWGAVVFEDSEKERYFDEDCMSLILSYARLFVNAIIRNDMELEMVRQNDINKKIAKDAAQAVERTRLMLDATPLSCLMWTNDFRIIDCNITALELYKLKSRQEVIERFLELSPEYQPDGQLSEEKGRKYVEKAYAEGSSIMDWTHILDDGTVLPVETTLVRVLYKGEHVVVGFSRDLRQIKNMESNILRLESESEKIYYDPLTGSYNRRFFDENLSRVINTLSRSSGILSLMMIDIDYFKNYNDSYGHAAGDDCLRTIAKILLDNTARADDFVVRYGGDEFAIVLPNTEESGARMIAEKIVKNIGNYTMRIEPNGEAITVTTSIGVATGKVKPRHRADDFILRADELLYKSKQDGRNRYTSGLL